MGLPENGGISFVKHMVIPPRAQALKGSYVFALPKQIKKEDQSNK
jgi:hypothetical protein